MPRISTFAIILRLLLPAAAWLTLTSCDAPISAREKKSPEGVRTINSVDPSFLPLPPAPPHDTPVVRLGAELFSERKLSGDNTVSCASCHQLFEGGGDSQSFSRGIKGRTGDANSPTIFNATLNFRQFWDGRASSLLEQVNGPLTNEKEMGSTWEAVAAKLNADPAYRSKFMAAFGKEADRDSISRALVEFQGTLLTPNAPFDRFLRGEKEALTPPQKRGYEKFRTLGCVACHQGVNLGGNMYQTLGVLGDYFKDRGGSYPSDQGLFRSTGRASDMHIFRVPSLRNVELTPPYFHDGQVATLEDAVRTMAKYQLGRKLSVEEVSDLTAFLRSLTGELPASLSKKEEK